MPNPIDWDNATRAELDALTKAQSDSRFNFVDGPPVRTADHHREGDAVRVTVPAQWVALLAAGPFTETPGPDDPDAHQDRWGKTVTRRPDRLPAIDAGPGHARAMLHDRRTLLVEDDPSELVVELVSDDVRYGVTVGTAAEPAQTTLRALEPATVTGADGRQVEVRWALRWPERDLGRILGDPTSTARKEAIGLVRDHTGCPTRAAARAVDEFAPAAAGLDGHVLSRIICSLLYREGGFTDPVALLGPIRTYLERHMPDRVDWSASIDGQAVEVTTSLPAEDTSGLGDLVWEVQPNAINRWRGLYHPHLLISGLGEGAGDPRRHAHRLAAALVALHTHQGLADLAARIRADEDWSGGTTIRLDVVEDEHEGGLFAFDDDAMAHVFTS